MENISLHILDIVENSIRARAKMVSISIEEDDAGDLLTIKIEDDGHGMDEEMLCKVLDPFATTRTTRRVGLGLSLLAESARQTGGELTIRSSVGQGTIVKALFHSRNIDMKPLGDMINTLMTLVIGNPQVEFLYRHRKGSGDFCLDTLQIKKELDGLPWSDPDVVKILRQFLQDGFEELGVSFY